jgi:hypothetical protein
MSVGSDAALSTTMATRSLFAGWWAIVPHRSRSRVGASPAGERPAGPCHASPRTVPWIYGLAGEALRGAAERMASYTTLSEVEESRNEQDRQRNNRDGEYSYVVRPALVA